MSQVNVHLFERFPLGSCIKEVGSAKLAGTGAGKMSDGKDDGGIAPEEADLRALSQTLLRAIEAELDFDEI